jgi:soluble lytic murein transglycosylase-like protein
MAVAATESSFNHSVGNPGGGNDPRKPFGIMQVAGQFHPEKFPQREVRRTTVKENIEIGAQVLKEYLASEGGNERRALLRYNGSLNISDKYFLRVRRLKQTLRHGLMAMKTSLSVEDRG